MKRSQRRGRTGLVVGLVAIALLVPLTAYAEPGEHPPYAVGGPIDGPNPPEMYEDFADCPTIDQFPEDTTPIGCLKLIAYDGDIQLGDVQAELTDPIEMVMGLAMGSDADGNPAGYVVPAEGGSGGGPPAVEMEGGLLGTPELDPLIDADPLGLLSVSARPVLDDPTVPAEGALELLSWLSGSNSNHVDVTLPLSIEIENLLLGSKCQIPQFDINLTTGETEPPEPFDPMAGTHGDSRLTGWYPAGMPFGGFGANSSLDTRVGSRLVDNTFAVPGARKCDAVVGDLLDQPNGLFDGVVNNQSGLPADPGQNHLALSVDTHMVSYSNFLMSAIGDPADIDFGEVAVGETSDIRTLVIEGAGSMTFTPDAPEFTTGADGFEVVDDRCVGQPLDDGDTCEVDVAFAPTEAGDADANLEFGAQEMATRVAWTGGGSGSSTFQGEGVSP